MINWNILESAQQLEQLDGKSSDTPFAIFKHSTRCVISSSAKRNLEAEWTLTDQELPIYHLDLLAHRSISAAIAEKYQIPHESPQLLVIKNGEVIYHASHHSIQASTLQQVL